MHDRLVARRRLVVAVAAILVAASSVVATGTRFDMSFKPFFSNDSDLIAETEILEAEFGQRLGAFIGVVVSCDCTDDPAFLGDLDRASSDVRAIASVSEVISLTRFAVPVWTADGVTAASISIEDADARDLVRGLLLSADGRKSMMLVRLDQPMDDLAGRTETIEAVRTTAEAALGDWGEVTMVGYSVVEAGFAAIVLRSLLVNFAFTFAVLALILWLVYRRARLVVAALCAVTLATPVTVAVVYLLGQDATMINSMVPVVILIIGIADAIHMIESYREHRTANGRHESVRRMMAEVALPCLLTTVTTAAGFLGLTMAKVVAIRDFGLNVAIGIVIAWVFNFTILPLILSLGKGSESVPVRRGAGIIARIMSGSARAISAARIPVVLGFALLTILMTVSVPSMELDQYVNGEVSSTEPIRADQAMTEAAFGGYLGPDIAIRRTDGGPMTGLAERAAVEAFAIELEALKGVDRVERITSWVPPVVSGPAALSGLDHLRGDPIAGPRIRSLINAGGTTVSVAVYVGDIGTNRAERLVSSIRRQAHASLGDEYETTVYGHWHLAQTGMQRISRDMVVSFATSFFLVFPIMALALGSFRLIVISIAPNLIPALFALAMAVWLDIPIRVGTAMVLAIAMGIAVDDTIHLMLRLKRESAAGAPAITAIQNTVRRTGRAILLTSVVLVAGFATMWSNELFAIRDMGIVAAGTLLVAFLADVYLVPALYLLFPPRSQTAATRPATDVGPLRPAIPSATAWLDSDIRRNAR